MSQKPKYQAPWRDAEFAPRHANVPVKPCWTLQPDPPMVNAVQSLARSLPEASRGLLSPSSGEGQGWAQLLRAGARRAQEMPRPALRAPTHSHGV